MGRLRSDAKAVAAIVVGATMGVAGTVVALRAFEAGEETADACVETPSKIVYSLRSESARKGSAVVFTPSVPRHSVPARCREAGAERHRTVIRSYRVEPSRVRVRMNVHELRSRETHLGAQEAELRARAEELRARGEELRVRGEELRVRGEELRERGGAVEVDEDGLRARIDALRAGGADLDARAEDLGRQVEELRLRMERLRSDAPDAGDGSGAEDGSGG